MLPWILLTAVALIGLLVAERFRYPWGVYLCKPVASAGFVGAAVAAGALDSSYGRTILAALVLSWLGDAFLMSARSALFLAGLGSFLLAHVAFGAAFAIRGQAAVWTAGALALLAVPALIVARWLRPHLPADMRVPVHVYIVVITCMLALAAGAVAAGAPWIVLLGALTFYLSDLSVANDRFVRESFLNKLWGLPLYYFAQICLAASV
ncbi:MAG TPA: lysoplasmalogenase [Thermoanaerobaculia bacterium]